jgi:PAS domain S-box-containing protein
MQGCAVCVCAADGSFRCASELVRKLAQGPGGFDGRNVFSLFQGEDFEAFRECWDRAFSSLEAAAFGPWPAGGGPGRTVGGWLIPIPEGGACVGVLCFLQEALAVEDEERPHMLASIPQECPHPLLGVTNEFEVEYANPASRSMLRDLGAEPGGRLPESLRQAVAFSFTSGASVEHEAVHGDRAYSLVTVPSQDARRAYVYGLDIARRKAAERALRQCGQRYRELVETVGDWLWEVDAHTVYTYSSPRVESLLGYRPEEMVGKTPFDFMPREEARRVEAVYREHWEQRRPFHGLENEALRRDGSVVVLETSAEPVFDVSGEFRGYRGVDRDITERKRAERELQEARGLLESRVQERTRDLGEAVERLESEAAGHRRTRAALERAVMEKEAYRRNLDTVFQSIPDAIVTVDREMRVLNVNRALQKFCTRAGEIEPGRPLPLDEAEPPACAVLLQRTLRCGAPMRMYRTECRCGTRTNQVVLLNSAPLLDARGDHAGAVMIVRDISRLAALEKQLNERTHYGGMIGKSKEIQSIYAVLEQLANLDTTVLVTGESGTGKELVVEALHYSGSRLTGPLVKVNCSALSEGLLESELFGHVRGAFTGAVSDKIGRFQAAEGGAIFLDEIGDISPAIQLKLLRVLERKELERVGDSTTHKVDVRVVTATNTDLAERVRQGLFRADLYYRLRVMVIHLPPLRERAEDIPLLVEHFIDHFNQMFGKELLGVANEVMEVFLRNSWPGNVRELKHCIEHACILCPAGYIGLEHLPRDLVWRHPGPEEPRPPAPEEGQSARDHLLAVLADVRWNKSRAAEKLGVSRTTLYRRLHELGIQG